jgi:hypothetical protein
MEMNDRCLALAEVRSADAPKKKRPNELLAAEEAKATEVNSPAKIKNATKRPRLVWGRRLRTKYDTEGFIWGIFIDFSLWKPSRLSSGESDEAGHYSSM